MDIFPPKKNKFAGTYSTSIQIAGGEFKSTIRSLRIHGTLSDSKKENKA
jgi:hypothetical protein